MLSFFMYFFIVFHIFTLRIYSIYLVLIIKLLNKHSRLLYKHLLNLANFKKYKLAYLEYIFYKSWHTLKTPFLIDEFVDWLYHRFVHKCINIYRLVVILVPKENLGHFLPAVSFCTEGCWFSMIPQKTCPSCTWIAPLCSIFNGPKNYKTIQKKLFLVTQINWSSTHLY